MPITFHIDKEESDQTGTLAIKISQPLSLEGIRKLSLLEHQALLYLLHEQESAYQRKMRTNRIFIGGMTALSTFHVAYSKVIEVLKKLDATRALYFNQEKLLCDFYSKNEFYFLTNTDHETHKVQVSGHIKSNGKEFALTSCDFICGGHPLIYIKNAFLRCISTEVGWKDFKQLYVQPESVSFLKLKEAYDEQDPEHPLFICQENNQASLQAASTPWPLLVLKERTGAFADLWMVYPTLDEPIRVACHEPATSIRDRRGLLKVRRQLPAESEWEKDLLESDYVKKMVGDTHYYCPLDCVAKSLTFLLEIGWQVEDWEGRQVCRQTETALEIETAEQAVLIKGKIKYGQHDASLQDVMGAFNKKERFVQLGVGVVGLLPQKIENVGLLSVMEEGQITSHGIALKQNRFGLLADVLDSTPHIHTDDAFKALKEKLLCFTGIEETPPGIGFNGSLRPYQQVGLNWLNFLYNFGFHGLLADDMGLGKTIQVLAFLSCLDSQKPILIVLPTSLIFNWQREIERFLPHAQLLVHHGQMRTKMLADSNAAGQIILTTYTTLRMDLTLFQKLSYECIILDEAQSIKNATTATARSLYALQSRFRLSLTGTPIENHASELWAHFRFLMPDLFGEENAFLAQTTAAAVDYRHLERIRKKIKPFVLRRQKQEVAADLPEKIEQIVWLEMTAEQKQVYDDFLAGFKGNLFKKIESDGTSKHRMEILEAILRLRQICCHPRLAIESEASSAKMDAVLADLEVAIEEGRKVLLYSQFTGMLGLLAQEVKKRGWPFAYLDGKTTNREKVVQQFQEDKNMQLFLISLKAGGIGLNLTAADYVFLYDPWWNDAVENQAIDRAHRIGRQDTVIAKRYVVLESIEEKMMKLKAHKKALINDLMQEDELANVNLSIDDLKFLLT